MTLGLGIDYSTAKVHMAVVGRDAFVETCIVPHGEHDASKGIELLAEALKALENHGRIGLVVLEEPYYGHENPQSLLQLATIMGCLWTLCVQQGLKVRRMKASEWRPMAGVVQFSGPGKHRNLVRSELKADALRVAKLKHGIDTKDDNLAEAVLMGGVAYGLASQGR